MTDDRIDPQCDPATAAVQRHADKYNDPRARITAGGLSIAAGVLLLGILGAGASIYARRTRLEQSTRFWGAETITALQLAERMELLPRGGSQFEPVELTATPGLGHLRHTLLDERSFDWQSEGPGGAAEKCREPGGDEVACVQLRLTDPTAHRFDVVEIDLDLTGGWVGPSDGSRRVQTTSWVRPKLRNFFTTILNVEQMRADLRD